MPFADTPIAEYISKQIDAVAPYKNQREIAAEIGYEKPNMISMFKRGEARIPLDKIPLLAKSLNIDPAFLFRLAMQQYFPTWDKAISEIFGTILNANERERMVLEREYLEGDEVNVTNEFKRELKALLKKHKK